MTTSTRLHPHAASLIPANRQTKRLAKATMAHRLPDGSIAVRYHATDLLTFRPDGKVVVTSGGFRSKTTKDRINAYLPPGFPRVWQAKGVWTYGGAPLMDGDTISRAGKLAPAKGRAKEPARIAALTKRINLHAQRCADAIPLPMPSGGDDWFSALVVSEGPDKGKTLGEATGNTSHLEGNMEEGYVVPSLVLRALEATDAGDAIKAATFGQCASFEGIAKDRVRKAVRRYLKGRFGLAGGAFNRNTSGLFAVRG